MQCEFTGMNMLSWIVAVVGWVLFLIFLRPTSGRLPLVLWSLATLTIVVAVTGCVIFLDPSVCWKIWVEAILATMAMVGYAYGLWKWVESTL